MTHTDDHMRFAALALATPLIANTTSVFNALIGLLALLPPALVLARMSATTTGTNVITRITVAVIASAVLMTIVLFGIGHLAPKPWSGDVVDAYTVTLMLAALSTPAFAIAPAAPLPIARFATLLLLTGLVAEIFGYGALLGDHEIAFAGATAAWRLQLLSFAPLPFAASPAGALMIAAIVYAAMQRFGTAQQTAATPLPTISEPRRGRRVRVTGHIS